MQKPESPPTVSCKMSSPSAFGPPGGLHPRPRLGPPPHPRPFTAGPHGPRSLGKDPGKHSREERRLTRVVHGAHAASWGNVSSRGPQVSSGITLQPAAYLAGPSSRTRRAGKRKPAQWWPRETGSAEGQNSPLALLSQRRRGLAPPGGGPTGGRPR